MFRWSLYSTFTRKAFIRSAAYRFEVWSRLLSNLFYLLMWGSIWIALYNGKEEAGGIAFATTLTYIVVSQFLNGVNGAGTPLWEIYEKVRTGDIALEMMRPFDLPLRYLFADFGSVAFYIVTALLPVYTALFLLFDLSLPTTWETWVLFIVSAFLGFLIRYALELSFGLLAFWLVETGGIQDIFYFSLSLLSGAVVPLWFFPAWLATIADVLPFKTIYFIPNAIFVGEISGGEVFVQIGLQIFWLSVTYAILRFVWWRATKRVVVQGG